MYFNSVIVTIPKPKVSQVALEVKNLPTNARDAGLIPGSGRSPGGNDSTLPYSCLENPMAEESIVHGAAKSWTQQSD